MGKLVGLFAGLVVLAVAGSALAGPPAVDGNGDFIDLSVTVTPPISGTAKAPRGVGVIFNSFAGNRIDANKIVNNNSLKVHFGQNFVTNGRLFPSCALNPKGVSACPASTKVGTGTAEGELLSTSGGAPTFVKATLAAYNGKPYQSKFPTEIIVASVGGKPATELDFRVFPEAGGLTLSQIPFPSAPSSGPTIYLTQFSLIQPDRSETKTVKGKKVTVHLLQAPTTCKGSWTFSQTLGFAGQAPLIATDSQPCLKG